MKMNWMLKNSCLVLRYSRQFMVGFVAFLLGCSEVPTEFRVERGDRVFFVFSDTGAGGGAIQRAVAAVADSLAAVLHPDFIVHTGDCFHGNGLSSIDDSATISDNFESVYGGVLGRMDWFPMLGNHEYCGNPQSVVDYGGVNRRWKMSDRYYTNEVSLGGVDSLLMVFMDTSPYVKKYRNRDHYRATHGMDERVQTRWLDSVLRVSGSKWKIVFGHHPIYTADFGHGNTSELIDSVFPLLKESGVQAYFSGHIHNFQHSRRGGIDYFSTSTGGLDARFSNPWFGSKFWGSSPGFTVCVINARQLSVYFVTDKGRLLYRGVVNIE